MDLNTGGLSPTILRYFMVSTILRSFPSVLGIDSYGIDFDGWLQLVGYQPMGALPNDSTVSGAVGSENEAGFARVSLCQENGVVPFSNDPGSFSNSVGFASESTNTVAYDNQGACVA